MNLLDNWLVQALIGSFVYSVLCKVTINLYKSFKNKNTNIEDSQELLRINFYIPLFSIIVGFLSFAFKKVSIDKLNGLLIIFPIAWSFIILIANFENSIKHPTNKRINKRNKDNP